LYVESSEADALARLARDDFDSDRDAVVERMPPGWDESTPDQPMTGDSTEVVKREDELIELRVSSLSNRLLVLNVAAYPGWEASVDDRPVSIIRTNGLVQGVLVPRGEHRVALRFEPTGFRLGVLIAAATLAGLGFLALPRRRA
jgi:hypothetical protein